MRAPVATILAAGAVLGAMGLGLLRPGRAPASTTDGPPAAPADDSPSLEARQAPLPPDHPPIETSESSQDPLGASAAGSEEPPAITWAVPSGWKTLPNPNAMRIATYRPTPDSELVVVRAGGSTEANIQRWIGQFDDGGRSRRSKKRVRGLDVEVLETTGTYLGNGMMPGAPSASHTGWSLLGAVVETPGSHYFFKLVGPREQIQASRASFAALIGSIAPL